MILSILFNIMVFYFALFFFLISELYCTALKEQYDGYTAFSPILFRKSKLLANS